MLTLFRPGNDMKHDFTITSKESSLAKGTVAHLISTVDAKGNSVNADQCYGYGPAAEIKMQAKNPNFLDRFMVGDIVTLELSLTNFTNKQTKAK